MTNVMGRRAKQLLRNFIYSCSPISPGRRPPVKRRPLITLAAASAAMLGTSAFVALHADAAILTSNWYAAAPYLMPFDNSPPDPVEVMNEHRRGTPDDYARRHGRSGRAV